MIVCIDAGHDESTVNGNTAFGYKEDEFTLDVSKRMEKLLSPYVTVVQTRSDGGYVSLTERANIANACDADIFISLHTNAASSTEASGYEWWVYSANSEAYKLAQDLEKESIPFLSTVNRGIKIGSFTVLIKTKMPAVLVEHGFHTNENDVLLLLSDEYREKVAYANSKAILNFLQIDNTLTYVSNAPSSWAKEAWDWAILNGITDGTNPQNLATREQVISFLYRYEKNLEL